MAHKKSAGTTKNGRDSNPKYLGIKITHGQKTKEGSIIVRQRGTRFMAGENVAMGKDHTLYAVKEGTVVMANKRKKHFDDTTVTRKLVTVTE